MSAPDGPARARLRAAEAAWREASANYHEVMAQVEAAYMNGRGHTPEVDAMSRSAYVQYGEALAEVVAAREVIPTFEEMLAHPWTQADPNSEILRSIHEYQNAKPASAGLPVQSHSGTVTIDSPPTPDDCAIGPVSDADPTPPQGD